MDQTKREWLSRYIVKKRRAEGLKQRLEELRSGGSIRSAPLSGLPGSKRDTSITEDISIKAIELRDRVEALERTAKIYKTEILKAIDALDDPIRAEILEKHFIYDQSIGSIADELNYTERHTIRLYSRAVDEIELPS